MVTRSTVSSVQQGDSQTKPNEIGSQSAPSSAGELLAALPGRRYSLGMVSAPALSIEGDWLRMPVSAWNHTGFRRWVTSGDFPESVRASFVAGEVFIEMSPEKIESHNKVKTAITAALERIVQDEDLGELYSDRALLSNTEAGLSTEPDVLFASWETLETNRLRRLQSARGDDFVELEGSPDLVVEIVSDSSERKDLHELRAAYARARIPEYWLIDARSRELSFEILALSDHGYAPEPAGLSKVLDHRFLLQREKSRIGSWRYKLQVVG
jgi:Uma2 family endonuclease